MTDNESTNPMMIPLQNKTQGQAAQVHAARQ
jgi:hypothetical protein